MAPAEGEARRQRSSGGGASPAGPFSGATALVYIHPCSECPLIAGRPAPRPYAEEWSRSAALEQSVQRGERPTQH